MSLNSNRRTPTSRGSDQEMWPKWMWIAVPALVVVVVIGFWWAVFSPADTGAATPTPTPTMRISNQQPTQGPTQLPTLPPAAEPTATRQVVPLATFTPTPGAVSTPAGTEEASADLSVGVTATVTGTGGQGLNMRAGAGTGQARVKTLAENSTVEIIGGPKEADGYTWWQVRDEAGTSGWVAAQFLVAQ